MAIVEKLITKGIKRRCHMLPTELFALEERKMIQKLHWSDL